MSTPDFSRAVWRKSSRSEANGGACVEVAFIWRKSSHSEANGGQCVEVGFGDGAVGVRDSKDKTGPVLAFTRREWAAFLARTRVGGLPGY
jgi:hypothetical protein